MGLHITHEQEHSKMGLHTHLWAAESHALEVVEVLGGGALNDVGCQREGCSHKS